ncbi:unnamed protein product [Notodromas monacha]|uniref:Major facilitator superfamily (MFS) profile domain-containing protein n=1 Tax=Notodromas monacha TaxID=399045 RepID=A0A7R9BJS7_9CRUS|nr:unnamed protein product [Notodromas monacha]CAG0915440.1 unnamed protein product [Notodromas monacha]
MVLSGSHHFRVATFAAFFAFAFAQNLDVNTFQQTLENGCLCGRAFYSGQREKIRLNTIKRCAEASSITVKPFVPSVPLAKECPEMAIATYGRLKEFATWRKESYANNSAAGSAFDHCLYRALGYEKEDGSVDHENFHKLLIEGYSKVPGLRKNIKALELLKQITSAAKSDQCKAITGQIPTNAHDTGDPRTADSRPSPESHSLSWGSVYGCYPLFQMCTASDITHGQVTLSLRRDFVYNAGFPASNAAASIGRQTLVSHPVLIDPCLGFLGIRVSEASVVPVDSALTLWQACKQWSGRQTLVVLSLAFVDFCGFACLSIMGPFFPAEACIFSVSSIKYWNSFAQAEAKGVSPHVIGLIFSSYAFTTFVMSPAWGRIVPKLGPKAVVMTGGTLTATACIIFGFLYLIPDTVGFAAACFVVRIIEAMGFAAYNTALFTIVACMFLETMGSVMALLEVMIGLGLAIGPVMGSALYAAGGYYLPFLALGCLLLSICIVMFLAVPSSKDLSIKRTTGQEMSVWKILGYLPTFLVCSAVFGDALGIAYVIPTLTNHLAEIGLTEVESGYMFACHLSFYTIVAPISGHLSDKYPKKRYLLMGIGLVIYAVGYIIIGPSPVFVGLLQKTTGQEMSVWKILGYLPTFLVCSAVFGDALGIAYVIPTLTNHLAEIGLTEVESGYMFACHLSFYTIVAPISGHLSDKYPKKRYLFMGIGLVIYAVGYIIIGPSPVFVGLLQNSLAINIIGLFVIGFASAFTLVPTFQALIDCAGELGYENNVATYAFTGGLWNAAFSLGELGYENNVATYAFTGGLWNAAFSLGDMCGPAMAASLTEEFGFPIATTACAAILITLAIPMLMHHAWRSVRDMRVSWVSEPSEFWQETQPLLSSESASFKTI